MTKTGVTTVNLEQARAGAQTPRVEAHGEHGVAVADGDVVAYFGESDDGMRWIAAHGVARPERVAAAAEVLGLGDDVPTRGELVARINRRLAAAAARAGALRAVLETEARRDGYRVVITGGTGLDRDTIAAAVRPSIDGAGELLGTPLRGCVAAIPAEWALIALRVAAHACAARNDAAVASEADEL